MLSPDAAASLRARTVFEGVEHFLGLLTPEGILLDANRASLELVGARREDVIGRPFADTPWFSDPADQSALRDAMVAASQGRQACIEVRHPGADGVPVEVELTLSPVADADGVAYIIPHGRPLAEQRRAERERDAATRRLAGILDIAADAIVSMDERHRIQLFNQGAEAMFGYRAHEVLGEPIELLLPEAARELHPRHVAGFASAGPTARFMNQRHAISGRRRDGELFPAEATISRLDVNGEALFTAVMRDISERRRAENELERS
ncbi:MAG TPA: PAS domain S-box protein, partial [Lysobacter sp.]